MAKASRFYEYSFKKLLSNPATISRIRLTKRREFWKRECEEDRRRRYLQGVPSLLHPPRPGGEKLYALDSQVSGLSRRVTQTGVTAARFIVFVNLGRVTSRRGSGYHPPRPRRARTTHPPPPPCLLIRLLCLPFFRSADRPPIDICAAERIDKKKRRDRGSQLSSSAPLARCSPTPCGNSERHRERGGKGGGGRRGAPLGNGSKLSCSRGDTFVLPLIFPLLLAIRFRIFGNFRSIESR